MSEIAQFLTHHQNSQCHQASSLLLHHPLVLLEKSQRRTRLMLIQNYKCVELPWADYQRNVSASGKKSYPQGFEVLKHSHF